MHRMHVQIAVLSLTDFGHGAVFRPVLMLMMMMAFGSVVCNCTSIVWQQWSRGGSAELRMDKLIMMIVNYGLRYAPPT